MFLVKGVKPGLSIDWVMHVSGKLITSSDGEMIEVFSDKKPYKHLHGMRKLGKSDLTVYEDNGIRTSVFGWNRGQTIFCGPGPDNPSTSDMNYRIERCQGGAAVFAHVITSSDGTDKVLHAAFEETQHVLSIKVTEAGGDVRELEFAL